MTVLLQLSPWDSHQICVCVLLWLSRCLFLCECVVWYSFLTGERDPSILRVMHFPFSHHASMEAAPPSWCMLSLHCEHACARARACVCHIFPGDRLIPATVSSSSVPLWQLCLTRILTRSLFLLASSLSPCFFSFLLFVHHSLSSVLVVSFLGQPRRND